MLGLDEMDFSRDLIEPATLCERDRDGGREVEVSESVVEREEERELRGPGYRSLSDMLSIMQNVQKGDRICSETMANSGQEGPADWLYVYYIVNGQENAPSCRGR